MEDIDDISNPRERSKSYPSYTLQDSLSNAELVRKNLGNYPSSREAISAAIGSEKISGSSAKKISTMNQFGLLRRVGSKYALSELHQKIIHPLSPEERKEALLEAFRSPLIYAKLLERLQPSGGIPDHLKTILIRDFEVLETGAEVAKRVFLESALFVGIVDANLRFNVTASPAIVKSTDVSSSAVPVESAAREVSIPKIETSAEIHVEFKPDCSLQEYSFNYWDSEGKTAKLFLLREMSLRDMERLKSFLDLQIMVQKKPSEGKSI